MLCSGTLTDKYIGENMTNLHDMHFGFNTSTLGNHTNSFKVYLDDAGNIIDKGKLEYGVYNKIIKIEFHKLLLIQKHKLKLGDVIDYFTKKLYIKNLIMYITNGNCGCEQRRIKFNKFYIPWYSLKFRELYFQDQEVINYVKNVKKAKGQINPFAGNDKKLNMPSFKGVPKEIRTNIVESKKQTPVDPTQIKKSCGCSKKNT